MFYNPSRLLETCIMNTWSRPIGVEVFSAHTLLDFCKEIGCDKNVDYTLYCI